MRKVGKAVGFVIAVALLVILFILPTMIVAKTWLVWKVLWGYVEGVSNLTGLNQYLLTALALVMLVPFYVGTDMLFSFRGMVSRRTRYTGAAILVAMSIVYNLSLYYVTKEMAFAFTSGAVQKWYAVTPEGVKYYDRPGFDTTYGIPLQPLTPDVISKLKVSEKSESKPVQPTKAKPSPGQRVIAAECHWAVKAPDCASSLASLRQSVGSGFLAYYEVKSGDEIVIHKVAEAKELDAPKQWEFGVFVGPFSTESETLPWLRSLRAQHALLEFAEWRIVPIAGAPVPGVVLAMRMKTPPKTVVDVLKREASDYESQWHKWGEHTYAFDLNGDGSLDYLEQSFSIAGGERNSSLHILIATRGTFAYSSIDPCGDVWIERSTRNGVHTILCEWAQSIMVGGVERHAWDGKKYVGTGEFLGEGEQARLRKAPSSLSEPKQ
jgi:hypothetical protein